MKKKTLFEIFLFVILMIICILNLTYNYVHNSNRYKRPILTELNRIRIALKKHLKIHNKLPSKFEDLFTGIAEKKDKYVPSANVNDGKSFHTEYESPFLYDAQLKDTYKNAAENTIIVASPRCRNKRYILLLKDVIGSKPESYYESKPDSYIKTMDENEFQKQAQKQNWLIAKQKYDLDKGHKERLKELKKRRLEKQSNAIPKINSRE